MEILTSIHVQCLKETSGYHKYNWFIQSPFVTAFFVKKITFRSFHLFLKIFFKKNENLKRKKKVKTASN
jgi:hypothetical protein